MITVFRAFFIESFMDRKPWQNNGPHRAPFGADRREGGRFSDRREGDERGFGRRQDRSDRREFGDRREAGERRDFGARRDFGDRRPFGERREEGRREFGGDRRGFSRDRRPTPGFGAARRREEFGVRSGPRARALETRRFSERYDFSKSGIVKLDADLADYFENAEAVNKALRMLVEASRLVKSPAARKAEAPAVAPETAEAVFSDMDFEDDVEAESYGQALEEAEAAEAGEEAGAEQPEEKAAEKTAE